MADGTMTDADIHEIIDARDRRRDILHSVEKLGIVIAMIILVKVFHINQSDIQAVRSIDGVADVKTAAVTK